MHRLPGRDNALLCHRPRPRFWEWEGGDPGQSSVLWLPDLTCGPATATPTVDVGGLSTEKQPICGSFYLNKAWVQGGGGCCRGRGSQTPPGCHSSPRDTAEPGCLWPTAEWQKGRGEGGDPKGHLRGRGTLRKPQWGPASWCLEGPGRVRFGPGMCTRSRQLGRCACVFAWSAPHPCFAISSTAPCHGLRAGPH